MKDKFTKDPNKIRPDHSIGEDRKYVFTFKDGTFKCEELGLECAAQGKQIIQIILPNGISFKTGINSEEYFTSSHFVTEKDLDLMKERGVFDEVDIFGCN